MSKKKNIKNKKENNTINLKQTNFLNNTETVQKIEKNRLNKHENKYINLLIMIFIILIILGTAVYCYSTYEEKTKYVDKFIYDENIVFVGDSLTYMYDLDKYYNGYNVVNSGVDGDFTWGILNDLENRVYKYNPSKVILLIGTNDIYKGKSKDEITNNVEKIIQNIKQNRPYCEIYLVSLYPVNTTDHKKVNMDMVKNRTNQFIKSINIKYKNISKKYKINYIDMFNKLIEKDGNLDIEYTKEGLHLVDKGYQIVTNEIKKNLR